MYTFNAQGISQYIYIYIYVYILPVSSNIPICSTCVPTSIATQTRSGNAMPARIAAKNRSGQEIDKESKGNERDLDENCKAVEIAKDLRENRKRMEDFDTE